MPKRTEKASPQSVASDDAGIMAAVAAQMQTSWEKKRKDKESKFLQGARHDLDKCIAGRLEEYSAAVADMNAVYEKFVLQYAQVDDHIRKLWLQLQHEQQQLRALSEKKNASMVANDREREKGQVKGMAIAKKAVEDFGKLIATLET
ncbi:hypothetical protein C2E23DRAFT_517320 [Lenzites betulinus]|nr:hypothetical protein C2E23DRAFT_517320 [Lenzites betulinus]